MSRVALRATSPPTLSTRSATLGQVVVVSAKIENTGAAAEDVTLRAETSHAFAFEPASVSVPPKSRAVVEFRWVATVPEGKDAHTHRGKLALARVSDGKLVGDAPLDVYVRR